jgi:hypothetical protein
MSTRITRIAPPTPPTSYIAAEKRLHFDELPRDYEVGLFDDPPQTMSMAEGGNMQQISGGWQSPQSEFAAMPELQ